MVFSIITLMQTYPLYSVIAIGVLVTFFISLVNNLVLDKKRMKEIKSRQKEIQAEMKNHKDNPDKVKELYSEMMSHTMESMKHSFKPMLITMIPILLLIGFIRNVYAATDLAATWLWWYIGAAILSSLAFRKLFDLP